MNQRIDVGSVLRRVVEVYRDQFTLLIPAALVVFVPVALLNGLVLTTGGILASLAVAAIGVVATYWYQGMVVEAVRDILDGRRDHDVGSLVRSALPVVGPLIVAGLLAGVAIAIGFVLLIVPGLFLLTIWAVLAPVIVVERTGALAAFGRSRELVRGHGWQVFGVILTLFLLTFVASAIVQGILIAIADNFVGRFLAELIVRVLVSPLSAIAAAVLYFELKGAKGEAVEAFSGERDPATVGAPGAAATPAATPPAEGQPATQQQPATQERPAAPERPASAAPPGGEQGGATPPPAQPGGQQPGAPPPPERP